MMVGKFVLMCASISIIGATLSILFLLATLLSVIFQYACTVVMPEYYAGIVSKVFAFGWVACTTVAILIKTKVDKNE